jgi:hypothetical protein
MVGKTIAVIGELLLGLAVILVHHQIVHDHKIDKKVLNIMHKEQFLAGMGMLFIVIGYITEMSLAI